MSGRLYVCPLSQLSRVVAETGAGALVSLLTPPQAPPRPMGIARENHLVLGLSDIVQAQDGHVLAAENHVAALLAFLGRWDHGRPLVLHCYAGVSRSPAAAFVAACALTQTPEIAIARKLRSLSRSATPNRHIVALADAHLSREGRMIAAIDEIGRGADCFEGEIFCMETE